MKRVVASVFDALWLPALLCVATLWLFAPWLHHARIGHLQVISAYEGSGAPYAWLFRAGDMLGSLIILLAVWRSHLLRRNPWIGWLLCAVAVLTVIDDTFVIGCYQNCGVWAMVSHKVHDVESIISIVVFAAVTAISGFVQKRKVSQAMFLAQVAIGLVIATSLISKQSAIFVQYIYQAATISWMAVLLRSYLPRPAWQGKSTFVRTVVAGLVIVTGLVEIVLAFHFHRHDLPVWVAQHSVLVGVLMLYLARQVRNGQRRAAVIVALLLVAQIVKYALLTPRIYPLLLSEVLLLALWANWGVFNRNLGVPPIMARLKGLWLFAVGLVVAIALVGVTASLTGHRQMLHHDVRHLFTSSRRPIDHAEYKEDRIERHLHQFRFVSSSLGIGIVAVIVWSLFRPATTFKNATELDPIEVERSLAKFSTSSEDFFKLWPQDKSYFVQPGIEGFIAFKKVRDSVFCLADPVCAPQHARQLLQVFVTECRRHGWTACFLLVGETAKPLYEAQDLKLRKIGSSAVIAIAEFTNTTVKDKWWRWQLNRSKKAGTTYAVSQPPHTTGTLEEVADVSSSWLQRAGHKEQGFALGYYDASYLQRCTLHVLRDDAGRLIAFANQVPSYNGSTQATVDLIRFRPDNNGAMPVLIAQTIATLAASGRFVTFDLGFVPLAKVDTTLVAVLRRLSSAKFSAAGLEQFKGKFKPDWQPQYVAYDGDLIDLTVFVSRLEKALRVSS